MWKVVRCLSSTSEANSPNKAMTRNDHTIIDTKANTNIFVNQQTKTSNPTMSVENDNLIREFKKGVKFSSTDDSSCKKFMNGKLESAIYKMKQKGATDPDGILSTFLKLLAKLLLKNS